MVCPVSDTIVLQPSTPGCNGHFYTLGTTALFELSHLVQECRPPVVGAGPGDCDMLLIGVRSPPLLEIGAFSVMYLTQNESQLITQVSYGKELAR